jgi:hypothetical protein
MGLEPDSVTDAALRIIVATALFVWNLYEGSVFEAPYAEELVQLYSFPFWRLVLVLLVLVSTSWCPRVGVMVALAVFFYIEDLEKLSTPWLSFRVTKE